MARFAEMRTMDIWYARLSAQDLLDAIDAAATLLEGRRQEAGARRRRRTPRRTPQKAHTRDSLQALSKLAEHVDGEYRIVSQPPVVVPAA